MPFWGLVFSSCAFIIPSYVAYRKKKKMMAKSCSILTITSILYHGTNHYICKTVDVIYAHTLGFSYSLLSVYKWLRYRRSIDVVIIGGVGTSIYIFFNKVCNNEIVNQNNWHMLMHFISQGTWVLHALDHKK